MKRGNLPAELQKTKKKKMKYRKKSGKIVLSPIAFFLVFFSGLAFAGGTISECDIISSSGLWSLTADIKNSNTSKCIDIRVDNVTLDCQGHTIDGNDLADYGIYIYRFLEQTTNITIKNCIVTDWSSANIYLENANGNTITNVTSNSSPDNGIYLYYSDSNTISNSTANSNNYGIYLYYSDSNTISNSTVMGNSQYGIYLGDAQANTIYNNLFNNTVNFYFDGTTYTNYWNTTKQLGTRIYSNGNYIGGNYWTNPSGTGYSDTCTDSDNDGFCDDQYNLTSDGKNIDYLSLSDEYVLPPSITLNSPVDGYNTTDNTPDFNFTVVGSVDSYTCELFINDTGYGIPSLEDDTENAYSCEGNFDASYPCSNAVDENWNTVAECSVSTCRVYENYTIPSGLNSVNLTYKVYATIDYMVHIYCKNTTTWQPLQTESSLVTRTIQLPASCLGGNYLELRTDIDGSAGYYEGKVTWMGTTLNNTPTIITANSSLSDGTYNWYINCTTGGVTNQSEIRTITIDTAPPSIQFVSPTTQSGNHSQNYIEANVTASDLGIGLDTITLYLYNSTGGLVQSNSSATSPLFFNFTSLADGTYYLNATANDTLSKLNSTETRTIQLDTIPPSISYNPSTTTQGNHSQNWIFINITASDTNKDTVLLEWNGVNETFDNQNGDIYWENKTGLADGVYTIKAYINDSAGNKNSTALRTIQLDTTSPTTSASAIKNDSSTYIFNTWVSSSYINVTLSCSDSGSGCDTTLYCTDTSNSCTPNLTYTGTVQISTEGISYIRYRSNDTAGNLETTKSQTIKIDTTPPTTSASAVKNDSTTYTFNTWTNSSYVNVTLSCSDSGVGCDVTQYCLDTVNNCTPNLTYSTPVQISTGGVSYIRYKANDTVGNSETVNSQTIKIDIIKITESGTIPDPVEFAPKNFTIYVKATSSGTITNCNLSLWYEGNNTKVIDNKNMTKGQGGMWNYTHMADAEGAWNWSVICEDSYSQNTTAGGNFSVINNPPENLTCSFTPIPLGVSDSPVANGTGVDPEGADLTWSWTWWVNGVNVSTQKTLGAGNTSLGDNVTLQCFASDGYNQTTKNSSKITVGDTTPAIIENSSVTPTSGTVNVDSVKLRVDVATDSHINWVKVEITSPDGVKQNYTMTLEANNTYLKSFVASDTGVYTFKAFALDGSGNVSSLTFTQNYTSNAASTSSEGGGGGAEPEVIVVERKEITTLTINIHPEVPIPPLTDQFPTHLNRKIKFKLINTLNNETILEGSAITDNKGNFLYKLPESIRKLKPGSFYNLTYYTPYGNVIKSLQVIIIREKELWGVMPRYVIFKVYSPLQKKCADIRVLTGEKKNCPLVVSVTKDIEGKIEAERTEKGLKICVSGIDLKEDEKIIGKLEVSTSCFETKKYIDFQIVHTKCPDLGIPLLVGSVELFGVRICKLFFLLGNILFYCGALFATSYKVKNKKKFNWGVALIYTLAVNVFLFVVG